MLAPLYILFYLLFKRPLLCCDLPSLRSWTKNMPRAPVISSSLSSFCAAIAIEVPCTGRLRSCRRPSPLLLLLLVPPLCRCHCFCHCTCLPQIYVQQYCCCDARIITAPGGGQSSGRCYSASVSRFFSVSTPTTLPVNLLYFGTERPS